AVGILVLLVGASTASAVPTGQLFLDPGGTLTAGCTLPCPFADITITLTDNQTATVLVQPLSNVGSGFTFLLGGVGGGGGPKGNVFGLDIFNLNGSPPTFSVTDINPPYALGSSADTNGVHFVGAGSIGAVGSYNLILAWGDDTSHGSTDLLSSLSFTVHNLSGTWGCLKETINNVVQWATPFLDNDENSSAWTNSITGDTSFQSPSWAFAHLSRCFTASLNGTPASCGSTGVVTAW